MRVQIQLRATKLRNVAGIFKGISDPYAIVTLASSEEEIGRTESIKNCLSPEWVEPVFFDYADPNENVYVMIAIWDDNRGKSEDVLMGKAMVNLKPSLDHPETRVMEELDGGGSVEIHVVPSKNNNTNFIFQMRALDVKNVEKGALGFGRTDPYLEIAKEYSYPSIGSKHVQVVYRSEVIHNHLNPLWERSNVNLEVLCDGNLDMPLRVSIWDYSSSKRTMIGSFDTNVRGLMSSVATNGNADRSRSFEFYSGELRHQKTVGHLVVMEARFL